MTSILKASKKKALKPSPLTSQPQPITTAKDSKASLKPNATKKKAVRVVDENEDSQVDDAAVKKAKAKKEAKGKEKEDVKKVESETKGSERAKVEAAEVKKPTKKRKGEDDVAAKADTKKRKNTKKAPSPSPSVSSATGSGLEEAEAEETEDEEEEEVMLKGFSSESGSDSSDEDDDADNAPPLDVSKLPTIAKDDATVKRKLEKAKKQPVRLFLFLPYFCLFTDVRSLQRPDRGTRCPLSWPYSPWLLRIRDALLLLSIRGRHPSPPLPQPCYRRLKTLRLHRVRFVRRSRDRCRDDG